MQHRFRFLGSIFRAGISQVSLGFSLLLLLALPMTASSQATPATLSLSPAAAVGTAFMYQGRLERNGSTANGQYDLRFTLYDAESAGNLVGASPVDKPNTTVSGGVFTVQLDFGPTAFTGAPRWLEIAVRPAATGDLVALSPRQPLLPAPYAIYAESVGNHSHVGQNWTTANKGLRITLNAVTSAFNGVIEAHSNATDTVGIFGQNFATTSDLVNGYFAVGVWGISDAVDGRGLEGDANATTGEGKGVSGFAESPNGYGVFGRAFAISGSATGVYGTTASPDGRGIVGVNSSTATTGKKLAGYFDGNLEVTKNTSIAGSLTKGSGFFKIDHPLDPTNKFLYHSFVESPEMLNVYNDNVTLDANGTAWVQLPAYFEALNTSFRYQLTPIGAPAPNLYVAQKVANNRFQIAGGPPNLEVSWQVTGVRQDAYARAHPIVVEEEKPADERGKYLHPTEHGQPAASGINYHPEREQGPVAASAAGARPNANNQR